MRNLRVAKTGTVLLTGLTNLLGLSGVLSLNNGNMLVGSLVVSIYVALLMFDSWLYLWILERINRRP